MSIETSQESFIIKVHYRMVPEPVRAELEEANQLTTENTEKLLIQSNQLT